jgi:hypothetical protein
MLAFRKYKEFPARQSGLRVGQVGPWLNCCKIAIALIVGSKRANA